MTKPISASQTPVKTRPETASASAAGDEEVGEDAAEVGGEAGGRGAIAGPPPGDRADDPAAVHRERRQQVEDEHEGVDRGQPGDRGQRAGGAGVAFEHASPCGTRPEPPIARPTRPRTTTIASVTTGPPIATLNSVEGLSDSRSIWATPPKIQSWMLVIPIPLRIATKAWPSSWRTIEAKKPKALTRASRNGAVEELLSPRTSPNSLREPEDDEEKDEEPRPIDRDRDSADPEQRYRFAAEHE